LGKDPETRYLPDGSPVCSFSVATEERWKDKSGEKQTRTEWVNVVCFGKLGEICQQYLTKGSQVYCEGKLRTSSWEGKDGVKRYKTEVMLTDMKMLGGKSSGSQGEGRETYTPQGEQPPPEDDIPF